jgi:hypothetical protein
VSVETWSNKVRVCNFTINPFFADLIVFYFCGPTSPKSNFREKIYPIPIKLPTLNTSCTHKLMFFTDCEHERQILQLLPLNQNIKVGSLMMHHTVFKYNMDLCQYRVQLFSSYLQTNCKTSFFMRRHLKHI